MGFYTEEGYTYPGTRDMNYGSYFEVYACLLCGNTITWRKQHSLPNITCLCGLAYNEAIRMTKVYPKEKKKNKVNDKEISEDNELINDLLEQIEPHRIEAIDSWLNTPPNTIEGEFFWGMSVAIEKIVTMLKDRM